jgi:D-threo-aldose 1-dehydrogenase
MGAYLAEQGIPIAAAALQASLRDERITSTIVGATRPEQVDAMLAFAGFPIAPEHWEALEALTPPPSEWIQSGWGT